MPRLLVIDAYAPEGRAALRGAGGTEAGLLYQNLLQRLSPESEIEIAYPADPDPAIPSGAELTGYSGMVWTGSSLTIHHDDDGRVQRQIELARTAYKAGVPSFGSCWAAQVAVVAAGGRCAPSPNGREFGVSRQIELSAAGRSHPLYSGKTPVFDALTSHQDEICELAAGATVLASNDWSPVQAVSIEHGAGRFWAVQYHPEFDLHEVASLCRLRRQELVEQGTFPDLAAADAYIESLETLHRDPARRDLADSLGLSAAVLDEDVRTREVRNWLDGLHAP